MARPRSDISTGTIRRSFGQLANPARITVNTSTCSDAERAATNMERMVQTSSSGDAPNTTEERLVNHSEDRLAEITPAESYAAANSLVALTGSRSALHNALRLPSLGRTRSASQK